LSFINNNNLGRRSFSSASYF